MLGIAQLLNEAWSYESNNDHDVSLRLYKTAFNNLLDLNGQVNHSSIARVTVPSLSPFEIRSVADYVNHRTCHIQFTLNHPREAIAQFKKYIDTFKQHTKAPEYSFEHAAWLSQQYLMFADLFHQAVNNGVKPSKAQHPGFYYYEAALQMFDRRKNITEYTNDTIRSNQMPVTNELLAMITTNNFASFLRQCGWTCINSYVGPPTQPVTVPDNQQATSSTTQSETSVDYSDIIIQALTKANIYFEEWGKSRMQNYINVLLADEYLLMKDFPKAEATYSKALLMYERENWTILVDYIKEKLATINKPEERSS